MYYHSSFDWSVVIVFGFVNTNLLLESLVPDRISTEILVYFEGKLNGTIDVVEVHRSRFTVVLSSRVLLEIFLSLTTNINDQVMMESSCNPNRLTNI